MQQTPGFTKQGKSRKRQEIRLNHKRGGLESGGAKKGREGLAILGSGEGDCRDVVNSKKPVHYQLVKKKLGAAEIREG